MPEKNTEVNGNHATSNNKAYELITEELIKHGLQNDKGKNAELLSFEVKDITNKGDGYTSFVTSITIQYSKDGVPADTSYVVKLNPQHPSGPMNDAMGEIFGREEGMITNALRPMSEYLEKLSLSPLRIPKLFASFLERDKEAILLENLRTQGFQMHDRRKGQDYHQALPVMEELGRFHASSLLLKEFIAPKSFKDILEFYEEPWLDINHSSSKMFGSMLESQAEGAVTYLEAFPKYEKCVIWLNENKKNLHQYFIDGFKPRKPFELLIHGDTHTNNMLFKYNSNNVVVDMRFVDLQCCRLSSPASDINYYAYSSLTGELRSKHFQKLLYAYYQSFSKVLIFARRKVPFTFKDLEEEVNNRKLLGLIVGLMIIQLILVEDEDDVVDFGGITGDNIEEFKEKQKKNFLKVSGNEGAFKDRFLSMFDEMLESHIFD